MDEREARAKLWERIKDIKFTMLVTEQPDGTLRSRPMATQQVEFDGDLWFFTKASAPKVDEIAVHQQVNLSYADVDAQSYVSVSGLAELVRERDKIDELWNPMYKAWFPQGKDDPDVALLRVRVTNAEYWDPPAGRMVQLIGYVKSVATGQEYQPSERENRKVSL